MGNTSKILKKPKRIKTAIVRAISLFMSTPSAPSKSIFPPRKLSFSVWINDEQQADYSSALMLVDINEADLNGWEDYHWSCVGALVRELGFNSYADVGRLLVAFWPDD